MSPVAEVERRLAGHGRGARGERHAHASAALVDRAAEAGHLRERPARLRSRAADLLGEHGGADAAAPGRVEAVLDGDVVVDDDLLHGESLVARKVGGHLEVHHVAGVVLDDVEGAGAAVDGLRRGEHLVRRRGGEDLARAGGVEHTRADEPAVHRFVSRAAAGDDRHLAGHGRVGARDPVRVGVDDETAGVRQGDAGEFLPDDVFRPVDELLHRSSSSCGRRVRPAESRSRDHRSSPGGRRQG